MERTQVAALIIPSQVVADSAVSDGKKRDGIVHPLSPIADKSVEGWIVDAAVGASVRRIAVISAHIDNWTRDELKDRSDDALIEIVRPMADVAESLAFGIERLGSDLTLRDNTHVLILPAESPQIESGELREVIASHLSSGATATLVTSQGDDSASEPVVLRDEDGLVSSIIDAPLGGGTYMCVRASVLVPTLRRVLRPRSDTSAPLAEIGRVLDSTGYSVDVHERDTPLMAIRSIASRAVIEQELRDRIIDKWLDRGVVMPDRRQVSIGSSVTLGRGVQLLPGSVLEGNTVVADGARIGPNTHLIDATIGSLAQVPHSVVDRNEVPARDELAPFTVMGPR